MEKDSKLKLDAFLDDWQDAPERTKAVFLHLMAYLEGKKGIILDFIPRPGVTYSLRAAHASQKEKSLFVMVDVIEDDPRWLSVCFLWRHDRRSRRKWRFRTRRAARRRCRLF